MVYSERTGTYVEVRWESRRSASESQPVAVALPPVAVALPPVGVRAQWWRWPEPRAPVRLRMGPRPSGSVPWGRREGRADAEALPSVVVA